MTPTNASIEVKVLDSATAAAIKKAFFINLKNSAISVGEKSL